MNTTTEDDVEKEISKCKERIEKLAELLAEGKIGERSYATSIKAIEDKIERLESEIRRTTKSEQQEDKEEDETKYVEGVGYIWKGKKYDKNKGFIPLTAEEQRLYLAAKEGKRNTRAVEEAQAAIKEREVKMTTEQQEDNETKYIEGIGYVWKGKKYDNKNGEWLSLTAEELDYLNSEEGKRNTRIAEAKESNFMKERELSPTNRRDSSQTPQPQPRKTHRGRNIAIACVLILIIIAGFGFYYYNAVQQLKANLVGVGLISAGITSAQITVTVDVQNPSPLSIYISSGDFTLYVNNQQLGSGSLGSFTIGGNSNQQVTVAVSFTYVDVGMAIANQITTGGTVEVALNGSLTTLVVVSVLFSTTLYNAKF